MSGTTTQAQSITWQWAPGQSPTACYVDATGIHAPPFQDILSYLQGQMQGIFGSDIFLGNDSQDGQMLGIFASAIYDTNSMAMATYMSYSPATGLGVGLSSVVKINGIARRLPTNSTMDVVIGGTVGTTIFSGSVTDANNIIWNLPVTVIIPGSGAITVTATASQPGAVSAPPQVLTIATPVLGWQTASNPTTAVVGAPLESDADLRLRQTTSTMLPSVTALDGMVGAVAAVTGVTRYAVYENDTNVADSNGIPGHSVSFIVQGGDALAIATAMAAHKTPGAGTYGTTTEIISDVYGIPHHINFFTPTVVPITVLVHLTPLQGYTSAIGVEIATAVANYINSVSIGGSVYHSKLVSAANLSGKDSLTFNITSLLAARGAATLTGADVVIAFNEMATASIGTVTVTIP